MKIDPGLPDFCESFFSSPEELKDKTTIKKKHFSELITTHTNGTLVASSSRLLEIFHGINICFDTFLGMLQDHIDRTPLVTLHGKEMFFAMVIGTKRYSLRKVGLLVIFLQVMWNSVDTELIPGRCGDVSTCFIHLVFDRDHPFISCLSWLLFSHFDFTGLRVSVLVARQLLALNPSFSEMREAPDSEPSGSFVGGI